MAGKLLSEKFYSEMKKLEPRYPNMRALLLPALHQAQEETGWLSPDVMAEIGEYIGVHAALVREVASFYTMYYLKPVGKNVLRLCTNVACSLRGAEELMSHCEKRLGIRVGETTPDRQFTLMEEECLGSCGTAPAMMVGKDYYENLTPEAVDRLIAKLAERVAQSGSVGVGVGK